MVAERGEDAALVARIARGDRSALEQLYRRNAVWLIQRLQSRCGDPDLVDMALQDTFVAVWKSARKYRGDGDVGAWLWGIAVRRLVDQLRKRRPVPIPASAVAAAKTDEVIRFEDEFLDNGLYGALGPAVERLDPDLRAVLVLTAIDGLTTRETATLLGIPQGTVKTRLQRARSNMKELLA